VFFGCLRSSVGCLCLIPCEGMSLADVVFVIGLFWLV